MRGDVLCCLIIVPDDVCTIRTRGTPNAGNSFGPFKCANESSGTSILNGQWRGETEDTDGRDGTGREGRRVMGSEYYKGVNERLGSEQCRNASPRGSWKEGGEQ